MQNVEKINTQIRLIDLVGLDNDDVTEQVKDAVNDEAERLTVQADALNGRAIDLQDIDFNDLRLRRRLIAERDHLSLERVHEIWLDVTKPDREKRQRELDVSMKSHGKSSSLRYFTITNARRNTIHLLAVDAEVARYIAWQNNRISDRTQGNIRPFDSLTIEGLLYAKGIEEAIAAGWPGELEVMGNKVIHKGRKQVFG